MDRPVNFAAAHVAKILDQCEENGAPGHYIAESLAVWGSISRPVHPNDASSTEKQRNPVLRNITASPGRQGCVWATIESAAVVYLFTLVICVATEIT
ncbi:hypothetical protein N7522_006366 [Penicillium canescens]|nr:hypothetical protein N7522_006366 [Penicillium canescens]